MAQMQYRNLGRSGLKVSQLSYGAWVSFGNQLDVKEAKSILQCFRDNGVNFFNNVEVYANDRAEEIMGQAIRELGWKRSDVVISTKIFWGGRGPNDKGLSRKHIIEDTKASLKRLDMDYVDIIFCHRPDSVRAMTTRQKKPKLHFSKPPISTVICCAPAGTTSSRNRGADSEPRRRFWKIGEFPGISDSGMGENEILRKMNNEGKSQI